MSGILVPLTQEQIQRRYNEIETTEEDVEKSLEILTKWFMQQPHLPKRYTAGKFLRSFLLGCKNRIEIAKQKIDNFFYYRTLHPEYLVPRPLDDTTQKMYLLSRIYVVLPKCTPDGYRILMYKGDNDLTLDPAFKINILLMVMEIIYLQDETPSGGMISIIDSSQFTSFKSFMTETGLIKYYSIIIDVVPMSVRKIINLNVGKFPKQLLEILKPCLSEKLRNRIDIISEDNISKLYDIVPKEILPVDYGGSEEPYEILREKYYQKLLDMNDWFADRENLMSDESKRPVDLKKNHDNVFGVDGSFKKINVD